MSEIANETKCEYCQKIFSSKRSLNTHKKTAKYCLKLRENIIFSPPNVVEKQFDDSKDNLEDKDGKFIELSKLSLDHTMDKKKFITNYLKITGKKLGGEKIDISNKKEMEKYIREYCNKQRTNEKKYYIDGKLVEKEVYYFHKKKGDTLANKFALFLYPNNYYSYITIKDYDSDETLSEDSDTDGEDFIFE